jgi:DoxX-like family
MTLSTLLNLAFHGVTGMFVLTGLINLSGSPVVRAAYRAWDYPANFYRVVGIVELMVVLFLVLPETRIWGVILGGFIAFFSVVTLLKNRRYAWSLPAILLLAALVPVSFAHR